MKSRLTESDIRRIVNKTLFEMNHDDDDFEMNHSMGRDEEWGETDKGEQKLQDLLDEARDILENECGFTFEELNQMDEMDVATALEENAEKCEETETQYIYMLVDQIIDLLYEEGFEGDLEEGFDDERTKRHYDDYSPKTYRRMPKNIFQPGAEDPEGTMLMKRDDDEEYNAHFEDDFNFDDFLDKDDEDKEDWDYDDEEFEY
jgi:hypothetical protein